MHLCVQADDAQEPGSKSYVRKKNTFHHIPRPFISLRERERERERESEREERGRERKKRRWRE